MFRGRRGIACALIAACVVATALAVPQVVGAATAGCKHADAVPTRETLPEARRAMLCLVNAARAQAGAGVVHSSAPLRAMAKGYAHRMVDSGFFAHKSPRGSTIEERARHAGYLNGGRGSDVGEALAWARARLATPRHMMAALLDSPTHRAVIVDRRYTSAGIGVAYGAPEQGSSDDGPAATYDVVMGIRAER